MYKNIDKLKNFKLISNYNINNMYTHFAYK